VLRLQNLYTVRQLADATFTGVLHAYPDWLQQEVRALFERLGPELSSHIEAQRGRWGRLAQIDWTPTVFGRLLAPDEMRALSDLDLRFLQCPWPARRVAWSLGAVDALDAAALHTEQVLKVKTSGPRRLDALRAGIERAIKGDVEPDDSGLVPRYLSARYTVAGRSLTLPEVGRLSQQAAGDLALPSRAVRAIADLEVETCLDLAAVLDRDVVFRPGFGRITFKALRNVFAEQLAVWGREPD
jgi:hypothetical protein